jgi:uncharacterized protein
MAATYVRLLSAREEGLTPDLELAALLYLPPESAHRSLPALVVGHGAGSNAGRHQDFCLAACGAGFAVLALDFRGHGNSQGYSNGPSELDVLAAVRFLREHPEVDGRLICYRGSSMGGFYGLKAAPDAGFKAMVLLCPAGEDVILDAIDDTDDDDAARWDKPALRNYFQKQDTRAMAARVTCPVLLVHARPDERVPFTHSLLLAEHLTTETTLLALPSGDHGSAQHDPAVHAYSLTWLRDKIGRPGSAQDSGSTHDG